MRHCSSWLKITLALLTLETCVSQQTVGDIPVYGWEYPAGGAIACTKVHTLFTDIAPVHLGLNDCFKALQGSVFLQGADFNKLIALVDTFCTETNSCTYEQEQATAQLKAALVQAKKAIRH